MAIKSQNPILDEIYYNEAAREYCESLPLEHFMESTPSATQREITLESFAVIRVKRPDIHCFNELLVQYPVEDIRDVARVVPDNMVVVHDGPIRAIKSFNIPFEQAKPFFILEYVSEDNRRKDYVDNMRRYESDLIVPYYLLFEPEKKQVVVFKLSTAKRKYVSVRPNENDRLAIPELELEVGLVNEWVRFWFRGKLVGLPAEREKALEDMARQLRAARRQVRSAEEQVRSEREARDAAEAELAKLRDELKRLRGE
jgi:Uma2 family endonuclease